MKILIMGLAGSGKTTLAKALAHRLNAVHFNADAVRQNISRDLGFSHADRIQQAIRMKFLCDCVCKAGYYAIADFICPTEETRDAFNADFTIFVDRNKTCRYEDTNAIFIPPTDADVIIANGMTIDEEIELIMKVINNEQIT
jgi:adenylylsulfate kinase-like enzyme